MTTIAMSSRIHPRADGIRPGVRSRTAGRPAPVRLTRRGRVVLTALLVVLVMAVFVAFSGESVATRDQGAPPVTRTVVVSEGQTLWQIASGVSGDRDIREVVYEIQRLNSLPGPELVEGQELAVPVR